MKKILILIMFLLFAFPSFAEVYWPPQKGDTFPDIQFIDQTGERVKVSDFKGKIMLIEYVGMPCKACQAFSGGNTSLGPYENNGVQANLKSIEEYFPMYAGGLTLPNEDIIYIQILLYDMKMNSPSPREAQKWAQHFQFYKEVNQYILVPEEDLRGPETFNIIPGFQLIDENLKVRSDSTGHNPQDNLYMKLLPMVPKLL